MNTFEKLRQGQRNVDWMKKEIEDTVSMMVGFACQTPSQSLDVQEDIRMGNCIWHVSAKVNYKYLSDKVVIRCHCTGNLIDIAPNNESYPFRVEYVQDVYENLEGFVQGMLKIFPHIEWTPGWKALMRAAGMPRV